MAKYITIQDFNKRFPTDDSCLDYLMELRFGKTIECPNCGRIGRFSRRSNSPSYACGKPYCGYHIHPMVGTPFEKSSTSLQKWFYAIYLFSTTRHGVSARELQRQLGVTLKTAWRIGHQIRKYIQNINQNNDGPKSGIFEADETYMGGKRSGKRGRGAEGKTVVFGLLEKDGNVLANTVPNVKRKTLYPIIKKTIEEGSTIQTDELSSYATLQGEGYLHETVNHGKREFVKGTTHVNGLEGFWSLVKRSIEGTHIHISRKYSQNYLEEFRYRYNMRKLPQFMFDRLVTSF